MISHSLLAHEIGHAAYSLTKTAAPRGAILATESGALYTDDLFDLPSDEDHAHSAITALSAGFFIEVYQIMKDKETPAQILESFTQRKDIPLNIRLGLMSKHKGASDTEAISKFDLEELETSAGLGHFIGFILCQNLPYLEQVSNSISASNHLLLNREDIQSLLNFAPPPLRTGNARIWITSGEVMHPASSAVLNQLMGVTQ